LNIVTVAYKITVTIGHKPIRKFEIGHESESYHVAIARPPSDVPFDGDVSVRVERIESRFCMRTQHYSNFTEKFTLPNGNFLLMTFTYLHTEM
jgi:hypothetical protein